MEILKQTTKKMLTNFFSLNKDDWVQWIAQQNEWHDDCDKFNGCYFIVKQCRFILNTPIAVVD